MLAPSNVWLNFSSCIVSGASGVKVPPAIKGSPFFRYCGSSYRRRAIKAERLNSLISRRNAHSQLEGCFNENRKKKKNTKIFAQSIFVASTFKVVVKVEANVFAKYFRKRNRLARGYCYILTARQQAVRSRTWKRLYRSSKILRSGAKILD